MTFNGWVQIALFCVVVLLLTRPVGGYLDAVMAGERTFLSPVLRAGRARLLPPGRHREPTRTRAGWLYCRAMLLFHLAGFVLLYRCCACRACCRSIRRAWPRVPPDLAFNTAVSFITNTNWQAYGRRADHELPRRRWRGSRCRTSSQRRHRHCAGRSRWSAASRAPMPRASATSGPTWCAPRSTCCCRSPSCSRCSLSGRACRRTFGAYVEATTLEGAKQTIAQGPVASQLAIKMLGTNGGGFFNANSAHPYENPTALVELRADAADLRDRRGADQRVRPHGRRRAPGLGDPRRHGRAVPGRRPRRLLGRGRRQSADRGARRRQSPAGNMEGKEVRFGIAALGAVRRDHDGGVVRRGQCHARQLHAARRHDPADQHPCSARSSSAASAPASTACCCSPSSRCSWPA